MALSLKLSLGMPSDVLGLVLLRERLIKFFKRLTLTVMEGSTIQSLQLSSKRTLSTQEWQSEPQIEWPS